MKLHDQFTSFTQISTSEWLLTVANVNELQMNASIDLVFSCFFFYFRLIFEKLKRHVERATIATDKKSIVFLFLKFKITNFKKMDIYHLKLLIFTSNKNTNWFTLINSIELIFKVLLIKITQIYNHVLFSNIHPAWNIAEYFFFSSIRFAYFFTNSPFFKRFSLSMFRKEREKKYHLCKRSYRGRFYIFCIGVKPMFHP